MQLQNILYFKKNHGQFSSFHYFALVLSLTLHTTYCMEENPIKSKLLTPIKPQSDSESNSSFIKDLTAMIKSLKEEQTGPLGSAQFGVESEEDQEPLRNELVEELIHESPQRIKKLVEVINDRKNPTDLFEKAPYMSNIHVLVGAPGTGKSSLAKAVAKKCSIHYITVALQLLANEYQHSGSSNLASILGPLSKIKNPEVIILDELQTIVKKRNKDDYDMEGAESLWKFLDTFKNKKNFLIIATANELDILPDQVRSRIKGGIHEINLPDQKKREKIIAYYLHLYAPSLQAMPSPTKIETLGYKTKKFTPRDLEIMIKEALTNAYEHSGNKIVSLNDKDFENAINFITSDDERFSICKRTYKIIKPHIGTTIQIMGPLTLQLTVNTILHCSGMNQARIFHLNTMYQQALFHDESIGLQKEGIDLQKQGLLQQKKCHQENKNLAIEHFRQQLIVQGAAYAVNILFSGIPTAVGALSGLVRTMSLLFQSTNQNN